MKALTIAITIASVLAITTGIFMSISTNKETTPLRFMSKSPVDDAWITWKMNNNKAYGTNSEESYRFKIFQETYKKVQDFDTKAHSFKVGLNKFADMSFSEFQNVYLQAKSSKNVKKHKSLKHLQAPASKDWRDTAVSRVKNQGACGSCWAFSAVGATEGIYAITNGSIKEFSEQQLVDCAGSPLLNRGCSGGMPDYAFSYVELTGLMSEDDYPYTAKEGKCQEDSSKDSYTISDYTDVPASNEELMAAISQQPVSIGLYADENVKNYMGGVYNNWDCPNSLNHAVLAVGYDSFDWDSYWIVKNSWGEDWGEEGYIRFARKDSGVGICGLTEHASYPSA